MKNTTNMKELSDAIRCLFLVNTNNKDFQSRLTRLINDIAYLKEDIENEEKQFIVYHLPPEYKPNVSHKDVNHFSNHNGYNADNIEQIINMCQGDRVDLEYIIIFRNV